MGAPPPVSCYIRTLNEAARIGDVVRAARAVADEVVVVDSGSTDATCALAEAAGARVVRQPWLGNGGQKRAGEDACRHDWLLDVDADEVVSAPLAAAIRARLAAGPDAAAFAVQVAYMSPLPGPERALGAAWRVKLYDRRVGRAPDDPLNDKVVLPKGARVARLPGLLHHYAFPDAAGLTAKLNARSTRNAALGRPKRLATLRLRILFGFWLYLAKALFGRGLIRGGVYGFATAMMIAMGRWLRDVKMYERARGLPGKDAP